MTTREKIIVGVMCLTVVYGIYEVVGTRSKKSNAAPAIVNTTDEVRKFAGEIMQQMTTERTGKEYQYMAAQAGASWTRDPFIQSTAALKGKADARALNAKALEKIEATPTFVFTGYLNLGDAKLAVINGVEYKVGEALDTNGHYLKSVSAERAVIGRVNGTESIRVPLSEIY